MAYSDFTLEQVEEAFGVTTTLVDLFPELAPLSVPSWLEEILRRGMQLALVSEKSRSEYIVAPVLLACRELCDNAIAIYSGQNLNVDAEKGLTGECDFILARTEPLPVLRAPLVTILEATPSGAGGGEERSDEHTPAERTMCGDIEMGLGQCAAQMIGARRFNEKHGKPGTAVYGCVTTGERWQFLRLEGTQLGIDRQRYELSKLGAILAVLKAMLSPAHAPG